MSIANNCMIVNISVGYWSGQRLAKHISEQVAADHGAASDAGSYNKHLIPKQYLEPIRKAGTEAREFIRQHTLPWRDNSDRVLTRKAYSTVMEGLSRIKDEHDRCVEHFLTVDYPAIKDQAEFRMGDMFDAADYPPVEKVRHRFYISLDIDAINADNDFRVQLSEAEREQIKGQMERNLEERVNRAVGDAWNRVAEAIERFAHQMRNGKRLHGALLENLNEIVDLLPMLNVMDDPELDRIGQQIKDRLSGYDMKELRKDETKRDEAANEAEQIMDDMRGFMRAMAA